ncbi:MAG: tetratricopeptide repeat protein, partial [Pyrinomonadaceae bacterium]
GRPIHHAQGRNGCRETVKLEIQRSLGQILWRFGICVTLVVAWAAQGVHTQTNVQSANPLLPPRSTLVPVHWPDLDRFESDVRDQLQSLQDALAAAVKDSGSTEARLSEAYGTMGEIYHAYSLTAPAQECYLNASRLAPKDFRWIYLLAKLDQQEGRVDEAVRRYRIVGSLRPEYAAVPVSLGNIYLELNRLEDAKESFAAALEITESNPAAYYGLGQVALSRRSYAEAVTHFKKALALAPGANRIHYSLAMAYRGLKDPEKAKAHLAQRGPVGVRVADPLVDGLQELIKGARVHLIRGRQALEAKRYAEAAGEFRKAIAAQPNSVPAHVNLGAALTQTGDLKGAAEQFEKTLRIDPANTSAHYNLAVLLANENKHEQAIVHLQVLSRINPNDLSARFFLAQELLQSSRPEEALDEFSRVVQSDAGNEAALLERVKLLQWKRQYKEALDGLEKGHAQYPQKVQTASMLAYLLAASPQYELRDGARALRLAQLVYGATGSLQHGALVGLALAELGRCSEAAEWQRKMIAASEQERDEDLLAKLRADLRLYEKVESCRPSGEISLRNPLSPGKKP